MGSGTPGGAGAVVGDLGLPGGEEGGGGNYIYQLDGNMSLSTNMDTEEEGEQEKEQEKEQDEEQEEGEKEQEEALPVSGLIPVQLGHRPAPPPCEPRNPVRRTVQRSNKLVDALSAPLISLYNVRSAWSKWDSIAEDIDMRSTDMCILTEVWQKKENKRHQKCIESMLEMRGIKYVSTPRPGAKRGGGVALACSEERFTMSKLNIHIPKPLEACFALVKPRCPTGKSDKYIFCSFYSPPRSRSNNKLSEFLAATLGTLRSEHPGARVILGGDINDMRLGLLQSLDPTLKQVVNGFTNKNQDKTLDVLLMDCADIYQQPTILRPMTVDEGKTGVDSDHMGVEALPRTNLSSKGSRLREEVRVQPFPESSLAKFGITLLAEDWGILEGAVDSSDMVDKFETWSNTIVNRQFPAKTVLVGSQDLPYFTEELRRLKRRRQRAYKKGKRSEQYRKCKVAFENKKVSEAIKYKERIMADVREGKRSSGYRAIRKLGDRPGEARNPTVVLPAYIEQGLTAQQSADRLAEHFSAISKTVEPLDMSQFCPALRLALKLGKYDKNKPVLTQHQVYMKMCRVNKPKSAVAGDVPREIIKQFSFEYAKPVTQIFNQVIQSDQWPRQWKTEQTIVLSKCKARMPQNEDDLRTISKTQWLSKVLENILGDYILPVVDEYLDPGQCGGIKNSSISHYLVKLLDFIHRTLDLRTPHAAVLSVEDLSKAYNRGSHQIVIEDLHAMHLAPWVLSLLCSYLGERSMVLSYGPGGQGHKQAKSSPRPLPGGFGAGTFLGGILFIVKFNGACLRPPVPRPISGNKAVQFKYIDDSTQAASINLKKSLIKDPQIRPNPLRYSERHHTILNPKEDILQMELDRFYRWTIKNKLPINRSKCLTMKFSRSRNYDFPMEFTIGSPTILEERTTLKILGIQVQSDLRWNEQVNQMVTRASKTCWVLRRMRALGVDRATMVEFWKSEGRVHLEMACPVWHSSLTLAQSRSLERCQRVAMAAIVGHWAPSLTDQLLDLGLERLDVRRAQICVRFAQTTITKSRHKDMFTVASINLPRAKKVSRQFVEPIARTTMYRKSSVPYLTRLLNS